MDGGNQISAPTKVEQIDIEMQKLQDGLYRLQLIRQKLIEGRNVPPECQTNPKPVDVVTVKSFLETGVDRLGQMQDLLNNELKLLEELLLT